MDEVFQTKISTRTKTTAAIPIKSSSCYGSRNPHFQNKHRKSNSFCAAARVRRKIVPLPLDQTA